MLSNNLDVCTKSGKTCITEEKLHDKASNTKSYSNVLNTSINIESLDIVNIKRETYYKMKFIINSLEKNWAIKKRKTIFYLKNLEDSTTEIITEDYLNKRIIHKIYNNSNNNNNSNNSNNNNNSNNSNNSNNKETHRQSNTPSNLEIIKKKEDIIPLKDGIHTLKHLIDKGKLDINSEQKNDIYLMIFLMNTLENGWSIRKKNDNYVFRKKHEKQTEIYSDEYLVNFLKSNMNNII
jgi:hypothetical protein